MILGILLLVIGFLLIWQVIGELEWDKCLMLVAANLMFNIGWAIIGVAAT